MEGDSFTLTGTFTDPGTADTHTFNWHVDASNGQVIADGSGLSFHASQPPDNGTYSVTFTVTDSDGATASATAVAFVNNASPTITFVGLPATGVVGVRFNLTVSVTDPSPIDTAAGFQYDWDCSAAVTTISSSPPTPRFHFHSAVRRQL